MVSIIHKIMMMRILGLLFIFVVGVASECSSYQTQLNEGTRLCCYYDTKGIPTIGVGFNLRRSDAARVLAQYKLKLDNVLNDCYYSTRKACLTNAQATGMFNSITYPEASACASSYVSGMPTSVHAALTDVAFAGCGTLNQFLLMKGALNRRDWKSASNELKNSKWCLDVKSTRCNLDATCIASGI